MTIDVLSRQMAAADFRTCKVLLKSAEPGSQFEVLLRRKIDGSRPVDDEQPDPRALFEERGQVRTAKVRHVAFQPQAARFGRRPEESLQLSQAGIIDLGQIRCVRTGIPSESRSFAGRRPN